jgi:hypothetical protein
VQGAAGEGRGGGGGGEEGLIIVVVGEVGSARSVIGRRIDFDWVGDDTRRTAVGGVGGGVSPIRYLNYSVA